MRNPPSILSIAALLVLAAVAQAAVTLQDLRCEYRTDPLGIDVAQPRLSWVMGGERRGERQTAWQVLVASTPEILGRDAGDLWDSGKVADDRSIQVAYAGSPLASRTRCHWKVRVWDRDGAPSPWSAPALWTMGLLQRSDWAAQWIGCDQADAAADHHDERFTLKGLSWVQCAGKQAVDGLHHVALRRRFDLPADRPVQQATLVLYTFHRASAALNGQAIGTATHWDATARLDATPHLHPGANVLAVDASHTDPYPPAVIGRLVVAFATGADLVLPIDATWKATADAPAGWQGAGFDDGAWPAVAVIKGTPWKGPPPVADLPRVPPPYLRRDFTVTGTVRRATVHVTALGAYELHLNGRKVSDDVLAPGWTEFRKRVHYQTYDVTALVKPGANAIGAILGDGWYASTLAHLARRHVYGGRTRLLAQLEVELADGTRQVVASDGGWKAAYGPLLHADLLMGCATDARRAMPGWDAAGFGDATWKPVATGLAAVGGTISEPRIQAAVLEPARPIETLPALTVSEPRPGCWTFDLGQNMVGWVRLKVHGSAGQILTVRHAEMLNPDGSIYTASLRSCPAVDTYVLAGGDEVLEPAFTFHGFRHVEITGLTARPDPAMVTGIVVHSPLRRTGSFASSHELLNRLYRNIIWGQKGNHLEVPTDCPQRDERMGWTGDTQFFVPTGACNFDVAAFFSRWLQTCEDDQLTNGAFPHVVPDIMGGGGATAWGDAAIICTWNVFRSYGDTRLIAERWDALERYMAWLEGKTRDGISTVGGFGDWLNAGGGAKKEVIDTAYHAWLAGLMAEMAAAAGREADAARYRERRTRTAAAFLKAFVSDDGRIADSSQTGYALAFTMDLLPAALRDQAATRFVAEIARFDGHLATGFIGTPRLLPALGRAGRDDVAYRLLLTDTYPSWLFPVKNGATTMWERWNGWTPDKGFGDIGMNSYNHYAFGAVGEYLYGGVGGIQAASPGYKAITIRPVVRDGLTWATTSLVSMHGTIATAWQRDGGRLALAVTVPANTSAEVHVPAAAGATITEGGRPAARAEGVTFQRQEDGAAVFAVGSGTYAFRVE